MRIFVYVLFTYLLIAATRASTIAENKIGELCIKELNLNKEKIIFQCTVWQMFDEEYANFMYCYCDKSGFLNEHNELNFKVFVTKHFGFDNFDINKAPLIVQNNYKRLLTYAKECDEKEAQKGISKEETVLNGVLCIFIKMKTEYENKQQF